MIVSLVRAFVLPALLIASAGWQQTPPKASQTGAITGTLRDALGRPAPNVRVAAVARPTSLEELGGGASMSSIAQTDDRGRFTLENVPPGRYYVAAGRLDFPTYFPGTQAMGEGTLVTVTAAATTTAIDFAMRDSSAGRAEAGTTAAGNLTIPLLVRVENGKVPLFGNGKVTALRVTAIVPSGTAAPSPTVVPLNQPALVLSLASPTYQIEVVGLPPDYSVRSIQYGTTTPSGGELNLLSATTPQAGASFADTLNALRNALAAGGGVQGTVQSLTLLLGRSTPARSTGATITGTLKEAEPRELYISGTPGTLFADGTFEFQNVPEGVHVVAAVSRRASMPALGATLVVGRGNMAGVELQPIVVAPADFRKPADPQPGIGRAAGVLPMVSIRGSVADSESGESMTQGSIFLIGDSWSEHELRIDGTFEYLNVLPGKYEIEVHAVGYPTFRREVVVAAADTDLHLTN